MSNNLNPAYGVPVILDYFQERYKRFRVIGNCNKNIYCPNPGLMSGLQIVGSRCLIEKKSYLRLVAMEGEPTYYHPQQQEIKNFLDDFFARKQDLQDCNQLRDKYIQWIKDFACFYEKYDPLFLRKLENKKEGWRWYENVRAAILCRYVIQNQENNWVGIDTRLSNTLASFHLQDLAKEEIFDAERRLENCRFDFMSSKSIVEVKFIHWKQENMLLFPDCPTDRGAKQLDLMGQYKKKYKVYVVFIAQRADSKIYGIGTRDLNYYRTWHSCQPQHYGYAYRLVWRNGELEYHYSHLMEFR